jgi:hypothetical protein
VLDTGGFALTEACYDAGQTLPSHAHRQPVLTFILPRRGPGQSGDPATKLAGRWGSWPSLPASPCGKLSVAGEPMPHHRGVRRTSRPHSLVSGILDQPSIRNDVSVAGLGLQTYREFLERDDVAPLAIEGLSCRWRH